MKKRALVAGALGLVGGNLAAWLADRADWDVLGLSRGQPESPPGFLHVQVDLADGNECRQKLSTLRGITHIFYAARASAPSAEQEAVLNASMLENLLGAVEPVSPHLQHVNLVHGTKWYGSHLGPYRTPAREDDSRCASPNFYYDQLDFIACLQQGKRWTWSTVRPHIVCGFSVGYPFNMMTMLAAYATISRELGRPLLFPGSPAAFSSVSQATDVLVLNKAMLWAATEPVCANQSFNIINGDYFRWEHVWPKLAAFFGMEPGPAASLSLAVEMADKEDVWAHITRTHRLLPLPLAKLANWRFGDFLFSATWDDMSSTVKAHRFGFNEVIDTEEMFIEILTQFRKRSVIP